VSDREHHSTLHDLLHGGHDAVDLGCSCDDTHAYRVDAFSASHEPILLVRKVRRAVDGLEGCEALVGWDEELRGVRTAFGELDERPFRVPPKQCGGVGEGEWPEQVQDFGVERALLCLWG